MTPENLNVYVLEATALAACTPVILLSWWLVRRHRQPFFREWVRGYALIWFLLAFDYAHLRTGWEPFLLCTAISGLIISYLYLRTIDRIRARPATSPRFVVVPSIVLLGLRLTGVISLFALVVVVALVVALLTCLLGAAMLQVARRDSPWSSWVAAPFFAKGAWVFAYPFLSRHGLAPVGYWVDGLLHVATGIGMLVFVLEASARSMTLLRDGTAGHAFLNVDAGGHVVDWNLGAERLLGISAGDIVGSPLMALRPRDGDVGDHPSPTWAQTMLRAESGEYDVWLTRGDGRSLWCRTSSVKVSSGVGQSTIVVMIHDVTERRATMARMRTLMTVVEQTTEAVILADAAGRVEYANPAFETFVGAGADALRGRSLPEVGREAGAARTGDALFDAVQQHVPWVGRIAGRGGDGRGTVEEVAVLPVRSVDGAVSGFMLRRRDVSEDVALRVRLRHAQKLEAFGRLASGVAHDFGNLMTIVAAHNHTLTTPDLSAEELLEARRANARAVERAEMLIRQLLAYSRRTAGQPRVLDVNAELFDAVRMLGRVVGEELELLVRPEARLLTVRMDPGQLEQVLVNLVVNARDAMDGRGRIVLATSDAPSLAGQVEITVTDDGPGIPPEMMARVFEPFFSTKTTGTGLGLSIVSDIVREAGGTVLVERAPVRGTTFRIRLPGCSEQVAEPSQLPAAAGRGKRGTVLVVEDEEALLTAMRVNLMRSGFDVLTAASPAQAVSVAGAHSGRIDLLLTDMTMPGGSGRTLAQQLLAEKPDLRVLFMSGYSEDVSVRDAHNGLGAFIAKPFVFDELVRRIETLLPPPRYGNDRGTFGRMT